MRLPNSENAFVEDQKILDYLLNEEKSGGKTAFFVAFGFQLHDVTLLRQALLTHAMSNEVAKALETAHGIKYIIEGVFQTPDGRLPKLRSVWIIDKGKTDPRFVTAYPLESES